MGTVAYTATHFRGSGRSKSPARCFGKRTQNELLHPKVDLALKEYDDLAYNKPAEFRRVSCKHMICYTKFQFSFSRKQIFNILFYRKGVFFSLVVVVRDGFLCKGLKSILVFGSNRNAPKASHLLGLFSLRVY